MVKFGAIDYVIILLAASQIASIIYFKLYTKFSLIDNNGRIVSIAQLSAHAIDIANVKTAKNTLLPFALTLTELAYILASYYLH